MTNTNSRRWTQAELEAVMDTRKSVHQLAKELNRSVNAITTRRYLLRKEGAPIGTVSPRLWKQKLTDKQIKMLTDSDAKVTSLAKNWHMDPTNLANLRRYHLNKKSSNGVRRAKRSASRRWEKNEDALFMNPDLDNLTIAQKLNRTLKSVASRRSYLKRQNKAVAVSRKFWTTTRNQELLAHEDDINYLARKFNVTPNAINMQLYKLRHRKKN